MTNPIVSMTGFGRSTAAFGSRTISVEIRSLNHRGLDVKVRGHDLRLAPEIEAETVRMVRGKFARGSITISVGEESSGESGAVVDAGRIRQIHAALDRVRNELGIAAPVDLATVASFVGAARSSPMAELSPSSWPIFSAALSAALDGVATMRASEGAAILADLLRRMTNLRTLVKKIAELVAAVPERAGRRLGERLAALVATTPAIDPGRLAQEVAMLAERLDVSEELVRLGAHLDHLGQLLEGRGPDTPGRRIDFLAQEIGREFNTLGGKIQDAAISALVIDGKAELEKLREQAQNIE